MEQVTRRGFVATAAAGGLFGATTLAARGAQATEQAAEELTWDNEADVVIVGGGGTGWAAAWAAAGEGASVLVLEKSGVFAGNTGMSAGMILAAETSLQKELGIEDSMEAFEDEQVALCMGFCDEELVRDICRQSTEIVEWYIEHGRVYNTVESIPSFKPYSNDENRSKRCHYDITYTEMGMQHVNIVREAAEELGAVGQTDTEVTHLIQNDEGAVIGVEAVYDGETIHVKAKKGVVLATAGIDNNKEMARDLNKMQYWNLQLLEQGCGQNTGLVTNTGDGIRMGMEIGAALNMSQACVTLYHPYFGGVGDFYRDNPDHTPNKYDSFTQNGAIAVNRYGQRFMQEDGMWGYIGGRLYEEMRDTGCLPPDPSKPGAFGVTDAEHIYQWLNISALGGDDEEAFVADGTLLRADTLEELAEQMGIDPAQLVHTVDRWNEICELGYDLDQGRDTGLFPIATAPFYAANMLTPNVMGTAGGLKVTPKCEVVDVNGEIIPRLYCGGMNAGGWVGQYYHSCGWAVLGTAAMGRTCGRNAAALEPWE